MSKNATMTTHQINPTTELHSLADECLHANDDTDAAIDCMRKKVQRRKRLHDALIELAVTELIRTSSRRSRQARRSRSRTGATRHATASEAQKEAMVNVAEELDTIWLEDFRLGAVHNIRLGLATKKDLATQAEYNEDQSAGNLRVARFLRGLESRMTGRKTVGKCLTGADVQKIAEATGYV